MKVRFTGFAAILAALQIVALFATSVVYADGAPKFPAELTVSDAGEIHQLTFTGQAKRVFLFFKVYEIAHYVESAGRASLSTDTVVADGASKAIAITFSRNLGREQIRDEFDQSLRKNALPEWLTQAEATITSFINAIDRDAREGDKLVFYWLDGGRVFVEFNGEREFAATDTAFAKLIWSIWFGAEPACDSEELLASAVSENAL